MTGLTPALIGGGALIVLVFVLAAVRSVRHPAAKMRGTEPGQGDQLIDGGYGVGGPGGGHSSVTRVTRDPQEFTRAMAPKKGKTR